MRGNFERILPFLFKHEGVYSNDAADPGGPTMYGIIYADLVQWYGAPKNVSMAVAIERIKQVTREQAAEIYKAKYWDSLRCDELPSGVDYAVFDYGVNSGIYRAAKVLQRIVGARVDGVVGGMTLNAVGRTDARLIIDKITAERMSFLRQLRHWWRFGRGWSTRVANVHARALFLLEDTRPEPAPEPKKPELHPDLWAEIRAMIEGMVQASNRKRAKA